MYADNTYINRMQFCVTTHMCTSPFMFDLTTVHCMHAFQAVRMCALYILFEYLFKLQTCKISQLFLIIMYVCKLKHKLLSFIADCSYMVAINNNFFSNSLCVLLIVCN